MVENVSGACAFGWDQLFGLVTAVSIAAGAFIAWRGLRTWRQEQIERRQCELGEEALALMYEANDVFSAIRSPWSRTGEGSSRQRDENETEDERRARDDAYIPIERMNAHQAFFERVISVRPRFRAIFGRKTDKPLTEILKIRNDIGLAVGMLSRLEGREPPKDEGRLQRHLERIEKYEAIKWAIEDEAQDEIERRLLSATNQIEKMVEPLLSSRYRLESGKQ